MVVTFPALGLNTSQKTQELGFDLVQLRMAEKWPRMGQGSDAIGATIIRINGDGCRTRGGVSVLPGGFSLGLVFN